MSDYAKGVELDQFWTRPKLARALVEWAGVCEGDRVLEPSCGDGSLVRHVPDHAGEIMAMDLDGDVFAKWDRDLIGRVDAGEIEFVGGDFLKWRAPRDAFGLVIMNPPYGFVGSGRSRQAADRLHVQHALRMAPRVVVLARANFLWGQERYQHIFRWSRLTRMAVLVHRPSFVGPALLPGQDAARHDFGVFEFRRGRCGDRRCDTPEVEFWTQDWRG